MTTPRSAPPPSAPQPAPLALKRVCTVIPVLRFIRVSSVSDILKLAHISDTFRDALENYSATVWRRVASRLEPRARYAFFERNAFAWAVENLLTVGQLDVSRMLKHPLFVAASSGAVDVVRVCLAVDPLCVDGCDDDDGRTALGEASVEGRVECVRELLAAGADITIGDYEERTALYHAADADHAAVIRLLAAHANFAEVRDKGDREGETPLHRACGWGYTDCVRELLAAGADIAITKRDGTALHRAAGLGIVDMVRMLAAHADFAKIRDARDFDGKTALFCACEHGHTDCVRELLAAGASITIRADVCNSVVHAAAKNGKIDVLRLLSAHPDYACMRDQRNRVDHTALDVAKTEEIERLLSKC